jgi:hypothetical protein
VIESANFPCLRLATDTLLAGDLAAVLAALQSSPVLSALVALRPQTKPHLHHSHTVVPIAAA